MRGEIPAELVGALKACRRHLATAAAFSLAINVLHLAAPLYMMQVYDRVMSSGSAMTLAMLTLIVILAIAALAGLDRARAAVLAAASARLDRLLACRTFAAMLGEARERAGRGGQALRDLDACRQFVSGCGMAALLDVPWMPIYVGIAFALHWAIGLFTLACAAVLVGIAVISEMGIRALSQDAQARGGAAYAWAETSLRNAHAVHAMAMVPSLVRRWSLDRGRAVERQLTLAERTATLAAVVKFLRMTMQSMVLGLGAWLVLGRSVTPGAIFASSLLLGRALQPVEQVIGQWPAMLAARCAFARLAALIATETIATMPVRHAVPAPLDLRLVADTVGYSAAGRPEPILRDVSFTIEPGESIGVIGPSGAGKSTLVRLLVGSLAPTDGLVAIGGIPMSRIASTTAEPLIGYMPQEIELFDDTVAANISRFRPERAHEVIRAAQFAGAHELIMGLPGGYHCRIGAGGSALSGGMRQRIGLARAVFGNPPLVLLDEPSAALDRTGDAVLERCIRQLQAQGTTVIVISHRPGTTALMSKFLVLIGGRLHAFGTRQEVMRQLHGSGAFGARAAAPPLQRKAVVAR